jgi:hypothetical protein
MTINISLGLHDWPGDNHPLNGDFYYGWVESIPVLVKTKTGDIYYGYLQTDEDEQKYKWKQFGRDGYVIDDVIDDVIAWAYATPTRTKH